MTKIAKLDRAGMKIAQDLFATRLSELAKEMGLVVKSAGGTFERDGSNCTMKFNVVIAGEDGEIDPMKTKEAAAFREIAVIYNIDPEALGKTTRLGAQEYRVMGWASGRTKNKVIMLQVATGKRFVYPTEMIAALFPCPPFEVLVARREGK